MKIKKLIPFASLCMITSAGYAQTQVVAHRGYWKTEGSAQNSITSLLKADAINCYGCEFDVWLAADNQLVVNHDPTFAGISMENSPSPVLTALKLENGENLPTLSKYLMAGIPLKTKLVLELKAHSTPKRETKAVKRILKLVNKLDLNSRMEYISFSQHAIKEFIRLAPSGTPIYYLAGDLTPQQLKEMGCSGPDYNLSVFHKHPEWIDQCRELGMKVNVWTVNSPTDMQWLIEKKVDYITTNEPIILQELLSKILTNR